MSLLYGLKSLQQSTDEAKPHILGYNTARVAAGSMLLDVWNGATSAARKFAVDLNGKPCSAAWTAGDTFYAETGSIAGVRRMAALAIGTANQLLRVNAGATAPEWASTLAGLTLTAPTINAVTITGTITGTPTWASAQTMSITGNVTGNVTGSSGSCTGNAATATSATTAGTVTTAAQPSITSVGTLTGLTVTGAAPTFSSMTATRVLFSGAAGLLSDAASLTFNSGTGALTATSFVGNLTGNASGTAATVTGAAQTNITSVGTLTALAIGAGSTTNAFVVTTTGAINSAFQYDASNHLDLKNSSTGAVTLDAVGTSPRYTFRVAGTALVTLVGTTTTLVGTLAMPAAITGSPAWASLAGIGSRAVVADANGVLSAP